MLVPVPARRTVLRPLAAAVLAAALTAGCGTFARDYPPTGVDGLTIPTPSPDPADFAGEVDNAWLPLTTGRVLTYDVTLATGGRAQRTRTVLDGRVRVAGVPATAVRDELTAPGGRVLERSTDYYAQDRAGNVWWLGHRAEVPAGRSWEAGADGAEGGLAMAETPRLGDGYRPAYLPGVVEEVADVAEVDSTRVEVVLRTEDREAVATETYEHGRGLVRREASGTVETLVSTVTR